MPHINTGENECDLTVSAFIVRKFSQGEWRVLLHRHRKLGAFLQFGGHVEVDQTPWEALNDEVIQESGYDLKDLRLILSPPMLGLQETDEQPVPFVLHTHDFKDGSTHRHTDMSYAFIATENPKQSPAAEESKLQVWFTETDLEKLTEADIYSNVRQCARYVLQHVRGYEHYG